MEPTRHASRAELEAGLEHVRAAPADAGRVELLVRRPREGEREVLGAARLDLVEGLVGDDWSTRGSPMTDDGAAHPEMQLNVMNARVTGLVARSPERWALAGDQLYLDLDLSARNLPAGTRLALGSAVIEVTDVPHLGCRKFVERFGRDALAFVNSEIGRALRLRGLNAKVVEPGELRVGDVARKLPAARA